MLVEVKKIEEPAAETEIEEPADDDAGCPPEYMEPDAPPDYNSDADDKCCASPSQSSSSSTPRAAPVTPKAAFEALRYRRHRRVVRGANHYSKQQKEKQANSDCASPPSTKGREAAPVSSMAAFQALRSRRHRAVNKGASHYKGVSQQQLLTALQDLKGGQADRSRSNSWSQKSVERTMQRWGKQKQKKVQETAQQRSAGFKYWQKQAKVMGHLDQLKSLLK